MSEDESKPIEQKAEEASEKRSNSVKSDKNVFNKEELEKEIQDGIRIEAKLYAPSEKFCQMDNFKLTDAEFFALLEALPQKRKSRLILNFTKTAFDLVIFNSDYLCNDQVPDRKLYHHQIPMMWSPRHRGRPILGIAVEVNGKYDIVVLKLDDSKGEQFVNKVRFAYQEKMVSPPEDESPEEEKKDEENKEAAKEEEKKEESTNLVDLEAEMEQRTNSLELFSDSSDWAGFEAPPQKAPSADPFSPQKAPNTDPFSPQKAPNTDPFSTQKAPNTDPFSTQKAPSADPFSPQKAPNTDPFSTQKAPNTDPFSTQKAPSADPFSTQKAPSADPFSTQKAPSADPFSTQKAPNANPFAPPPQKPPRGDPFSPKAPSSDLYDPLPVKAPSSDLADLFAAPERHPVPPLSGPPSGTQSPNPFAWNQPPRPLGPAAFPGLAPPNGPSAFSAPNVSLLGVAANPNRLSPSLQTGNPFAALEPPTNPFAAPEAAANPFGPSQAPMDLFPAFLPNKSCDNLDLLDSSNRIDSQKGAPASAAKFDDLLASAEPGFKPQSQAFATPRDMFAAMQQKPKSLPLNNILSQ